MPTTNHNTSHKGSSNTNNSNNSTSGFSLTTSLKGGARSISSNNSTGVDSTSRLREGINNNSSPAVSGATKNLRRSAPPPNTNNTTQTSSLGAAHPIQTTKSFTSTSNYNTKQQSSQNTNQQRRTANYRNQPNKSKVSPRNNTPNQQGQHRRSESASGRLWNNFTSGKSAFVSFYRVHLCVQYEASVVWLLQMIFFCLPLLQITY